MKTKLDEVLKEKYDGKKFMECEGDIRNNKDLNEAMDDELDALLKRYGATSLYLTLHTPNSRFNGFHKITRGDMVTVYGDVLKRTVTATDPKTINSLAAAMKEEDSSGLSARDLKDLLEGLPAEVHDMVLEQMAKLSNSTLPDEIRKTPRKGKADEDSLIDDILS